MSRDYFNPLGLFHKPFSFGGIDIIESPDRPRYVLPEEVIPGVPWPPGFREEINLWSLSFLGTVNIIPRGVVYMLGANMDIMRPQEIVKLTNICS